jgi:hypothetical protein
MRYISVIALLLAVAAPGAAQLADPLTATLDPRDRAVMAEVASAVSSRTPDIAQLDAVLAKLPRPTPLRGIVQTVRADVLASASRAGPAVAAMEDALRLLPDDPRPKLVATSIFTFAGSPQRAADLWMEASRESPDLARMSDRYIMMALIGRLADVGDRARADRISARLAEIGFSAGVADERSSAALAHTREAVRSQHEGEALLSVTAIANPLDILTLYVDRSYAALWPRIVEWAGADLAAQSQRYLEELRGDWAAAGNFETATPYARRLSRLNAHAVVVSLFLPMFDRVRPGGEQKYAEFLAPIVARSLATLSREGEAKALLARVAKAMPADNGGNALNIDGAFMTLAMMRTDWPQVIATADIFLARARALGSSVNRSAVLQVQGARACALWRTGDVAEAQQPTAQVLLGAAVVPDVVMQMHLCRGDIEAARSLVVSRLADETTRGWALRFVQPVRSDIATPLARLTEPVAQVVRSAPDVLSAANRVGRILPRPVDATLPASFDPFRSKRTTKSLDPDAV